MRRLVAFLFVVSLISNAFSQSLPIELASDRVPTINTKGDCFIQGGRIITGTKGIIEKGNILIVNGKIAAVGANISPPPGITVINAAGKVVVPGIVDAHSHRASDATNEGSDSITADVRIIDVLNSSAKNIWQALASGQTSGLVLHGSANAIGGQSVVVKWKYMRPEREMIVPDAPHMIKFALGENVTRSGSQTPNRFPRTRMGVEAVYRRAFQEAKEYMAKWDAYKKSGATTNPPRRDVRLEALAGILKREIWVQCHSYRADEMLMMVRLSQEFNFKIGALQHALEAYKIAPELAKAKVGVSIFADSWSYKVEAYDAIPYNAMICTKAGVDVSINTDSLGGTVAHSVDAAKVMRYGGLSETQALKMLTITPAKQLGIDHRTGSLEVGKDADIAIWSGHPLSVYSRCELTMIEGEVFFQRKDAFGVNASSYTNNVLPATSDARPIVIPQNATTYAIVGATVYPITSAPIADATVLIANGTITAVGKDLSVPKGYVKVNGTGLRVYPGFIDAGTNYGLAEIGQVPQTIDSSELGEYQPDLKAITAINIESEHIPIARAMGVSNALVRATGGIVSCQAAVINMEGWTSESLAQNNQFPLVINYPGTGGGFGGFHSCEELDFTSGAHVEESEAEEMAQDSGLKEYFDKAKQYAADKSAGKLSALDLRMEAMIPYLERKKPVFIRVRSAASVRDAVKLAKDFNLRAVLFGAADAWKEARLLAESKIPVILTAAGRSTTGANNPSADYDPYDAPYAAPAVLKKAGVKFCFQSDSSAEALNLPIRAAQSCAYGLSQNDVMRALTIDAADILGVSRQLGSIEKGKQANLIICDGDPLELTSHIRAMFVRGKPASLETKFTRLRDKYLKRIAN